MLLSSCLYHITTLLLLDAPFTFIIIIIHKFTRAADFLIIVSIMLGLFLLKCHYIDTIYL
jgi:hypothetical protein